MQRYVKWFFREIARFRWTFVAVLLFQVVGVAIVKGIVFGDDARDFHGNPLLAAPILPEIPLHGKINAAFGRKFPPVQRIC